MDHMRHAGWNRLALMAVLSFALMYALMYMMVDSYENVYPNINQLYMAAAMTGAMMLLEVALMRSMYAARTVAITAGISGAVLVLAFVAVRQQAVVSDREFLKSMIPHHGAALLMCKQIELEDPEIQSLCDSIIAGQQWEIDWMRQKLAW